VTTDPNQPDDDEVPEPDVDSDEGEVPEEEVE
jgi:hypothetical protein